ncbi:MAG: helix-turn-helix domain-containing protein [Oscillospiraceae bacterium]|nr:helix-turn-helix domain-containing protein [Oscillospiraceae bacterium]
MKDMDLQYLCKIIGNLSGIPIRLYDGPDPVFFHALVSLPKDPMEVYRSEIWAVKAHVGYFVTRHFHYYGIVNSGPIKIILGPTRQAPASDQELRELAFRADVAPKDTEDFVAAMKGIVRMPLESVLQTLCTVNYILNGEKLELEDISIYDTEQSTLKTRLEQKRSARMFGYPDVQIKQSPHNTYALEQQLLRMVRKGDTAALKAWVASAPAVNGGILASDQLRQVKNTFVVSATLVSRAAIHGGMDPEDAFTLSDAFIQQCELLNSLDQITNLQYRMVLEFAERVERIRLGKQPTQLTLAVTNYIQHHLSEAIRTEEMAKALYMSRPYLSARFRAETGETLTDFILKEKTEEAKRLLRYSDKTATAISSYLGFSSLGHFSRTFKKYTGSSPAEYREKYSR